MPRTQRKQICHPRLICPLREATQVTAAKLRHIRFVTGDVDIANGDGLMVVRMMAAMAAHESASKSRRIRRKMDENAANGRPHGGSRRPFGFEEDRVTIRPDEADVIRDMVARFLAGESLRSLATWMDDNEIRTVYGKPWRTTTLRDLMTSPRMAGLRQHREEVVGPAVWQPIITQADRARVLALVAQRRTTRERTPRSYLLTGLLRCSTCDGTLFASRRETTRRYVCMSGPDHRGCGRRTIVAEPLEELITDAVLYRLDTPQLTDILAGRAAQDEQTATISDALAREKAQREELAQMWADREINRTEWLTARAPIEARINELERRLARMPDSTALAGYVGNGAALKAHWHELTSPANTPSSKPSSTTPSSDPAHAAHATSTPPASTSTGESRTTRADA